MGTVIKKHWPLVAAIGFLLTAVGFLLIMCIGHNQGRFGYALDDPYIHMAMAKNFVRYGTFGITRYGFTSSTSSPLWTLLLSLVYFLFGVNDISPFILNVIFACAIVFSVYAISKRYGIQSVYIFFILLAIIFVTPLPSLIFCGQEHTMHTFLTILFVYFSSQVLSTEAQDRKKFYLLLVFGLLVAFARYEGLFLVFVVCAIFLFRKRPFDSFILGGAAVLPQVTFGLVSALKGSFFIPNPVLLKGNRPDLSSLKGIFNLLGYSSYQQIFTNHHIFFLIIFASIILIALDRKYNDTWKDGRIMLIIFIATTLLHMQFARTGWFYRYEAYLVGTGIFVIAIGFHEYRPEKLFSTPLRSFLPALLLFVLLYPLAGSPFINRAIISFRSTPFATKNIYDQQYQMALFLKEFYSGDAVAVNDIGIINYMDDIKCLDLWGLADEEIAKLKFDGTYNTRDMYSLANKKNVTIAMVFDSWYPPYGGIPPQWIKVGAWTISHNIVCGDPTVSFYAVDSSQTQNLIQNLRNFSSRLPSDVMQTGLYTR
jgi:hypothetical protein